MGWVQLAGPTSSGSWKEVSGVTCDRKMHVEWKDKVFKTIIRAAMTYTVLNGGP